MISLRYKLLATSIILSFVGLFLSGMFVYSASTAGIFRGAELRAKTLSDAVVYSLEIAASQNNEFSMQRLVEKTAAMEGVQNIFIVDTRQKILAHDNLLQVGQMMNEPALSDAILQNKTSVQTRGERVIYIRPLHGQDYTEEFHDVIGVLWVELDVANSIFQLQMSLGLLLLGLAAILAALFALQHYILKKTVIDRLHEFGSKISTQTFNPPLADISVMKSFGSDDEINELANEYNKAVASWQRAEKATLDERFFSKLVMDSMGEGLTITNSEGIFEYVNPTYAKMLGMPAEQVIGRSPVDFTQASDRSINNRAWELRKHGGSSTYEIHLIAKDGGILTVLISSVPRLKNGIFNGSIAVITNITERARFEEMKTEFVNRASHELRTPLTTAILMAEILEEGSVGKENEQYLSILKEELNRQRLLINDLLTAGRIESGKLQVQLTPTKLLPIIEETISDIKPQALQRQISIELKSPPSLPMVNAENQSLTQALTNLLSNAIKFSAPNSRVLVSVQSDDNTISIRVQDFGVGIPAADLPFIKSRFYRAKNASTLEIQGSGLGLYIVDEIMRNLGGFMDIKSIEHEGTTVTLTLPIETAAQPEILANEYTN